MAGLLEGFGMIFGAGVTGAGKMAGETFADQIRQEAVSLREQNMARINSIYAKEAQESQQTFTAGESEKLRKVTEAEGISNRALAIQHQRENLEARALENVLTLETHERLSKASLEQAERLQKESLTEAGYRDVSTKAFQIHLAEENKNLQIELHEIAERAARDRDKVQRADVRATLQIHYDNSIKLMEETKKMEAATAGATGKLFNDLKKLPGIGQDKAVELIVSGLSGVKEKQKAYVDMFTTLVRNATVAGVTLDADRLKDIAAEASTASGYTPPGVVKPPSKSSFDIIKSMIGNEPIAPGEDFTQTRRVAPRGRGLLAPKTQGEWEKENLTTSGTPSIFSTMSPNEVKAAADALQAETAASQEREKKKQKLSQPTFFGVNRE